MNIPMAFLRIRWAVAAAMAAVAAAAVAVAFVGHAVPVGAIFLSGASLVACAVVSYVHLRHAGLALLVALAPVPGLLGAAPLIAALPQTMLIAAYAAGSVAAGLVGGTVVRALLSGSDGAEAAWRCLRDCALPLLAAAAAAAVLEFGWLYHEAHHDGARAGLALVASIVSAWVFASLAAALWPFDEAFFVRANRARDRRERWMGAASVLGETRWGLSIAGIALVLAVLGWFGIAARPAPDIVIRIAGSLVLVFAAALALGRDWRSAIGAALALGVLTLMSLWLWHWMVGHRLAVATPLIIGAETPALIAMLVLLDAQRRFRATGDSASVARLRALETQGIAGLASAAGAAAAIAPWILVHGSAATLAIVVLLGSLAAAIVAPAIASALETIVPRRRSVGELYGRG